MCPRLQRDRTSGATDLTTCASVTGFQCDRATRTGVLGAGATGTCLQVEAGNAPARALYASLSLAERYRYEYWREPLRR